MLIYQTSDNQDKKSNGANAQYYVFIVDICKILDNYALTVNGSLIIVLIFLKTLREV